MTNGHDSDMDADHFTSPSRFERSESELSEPPVASTADANRADRSDDDAIHAMATSDIDEDEHSHIEGDMDLADEDEETGTPKRSQRRIRYVAVI